MRKLLLLTLVLASLVVSCGPPTDDSELDITSEFNLRWNVNENLIHNKDGSITFEAVRWGGMAANMVKDDVPADLSDYEKIVFEFAQPTEQNTQIIVNETMMAWGKRGITKLEGILMGHDMSKVTQIALQASDATTIIVNRVWLQKSTTKWSSSTLWEGNIDLGNWNHNIVLEPDKFFNANPGDMLEFHFSTDTTDPEITYWQIKTVYNDEGANALETAHTLAGNANELNDWGCVTISSGATDYRITLTATDVRRLQEYGLFLNGYHIILKRCNLLQQHAASDEW